MIDYMLKAEYNNVKLYHVRMAFSREMNERGKFSFYKFWHLLYVIYKTIYIRIKYGIDILYYPPSNDPKSAIYRDVIVLFFTRWCFKKVIFHFHAAGLSTVLSSMNKWEREMVYFVFKKPEISITSSPYNPKDGEYLMANRSYIIPLGIPDSVQKNIERDYEKKDRVIKLLFVGLMNSTKGEMYLLHALAQLIGKGYNIQLLLAGKFQSVEYEKQFFHKAEELNVSNYVMYLGVITGENKKNAFKSADIFCFPSFFASESFGIVLLEAMQYSLPLIATQWRGIQSIVEDGINGYLVPFKDSLILANKIEFLINNPKVMQEMGKNSRRLYLEKYTIQKYLSNLNELFLSI